MNITLPTYTLVPIATSLIILYLMQYTITVSKKNRLFFSFIILQVVFLASAFLDIYNMYLIENSKEFNSYGTTTLLMYFIIGPGFFLLFCANYTESPAFMKYRNIVLLTVPNAALSIPLIIKEVTGTAVVEQKYEIYLIGILYFFQYLNFIVAFIMLLRYIKNSNGKKRVRAVLVLFAFIMQPLFDFIVAMIQPHIFVRLIIYNFGTLLAVLILMFLILKYKLTDVIPMALSKMADDLKEAVLILDEDEKVLYSNSTFFKYFNIKSVQGRDFGAIMSELEIISKKQDMSFRYTELAADNEETYNEEITTGSDDSKAYIMSRTPVSDQFGGIRGRIVSFFDISEYKNLIREINNKNNELFNMNENLVLLNKKLNDYATTAEEVSMLRERNRIAKNMHDTLGRTLTVLLSIIDSSINNVIDNPLFVKERLIEASAITRNSYAEIRESIHKLSSRSEGRANVIEMIESLSAQFKYAGLEVDISVNQESIYLHDDLREIVYMICQESLTNSVKHGKSSKSNIILKVENEELQLYIIDNGSGTNNIDFENGMGLKSIKQRVEELNGRVRVGSDPDSGFYITVILPLGAELYD